MPKPRIITLHAPIGGLSRRWSYQRSPEPPSPTPFQYTTPTAVNVWPAGPQAMRLRCGRRAGMEKIASGTGDSAQVRGLVPVPKADDTDYEYRLMVAAGQKWWYPISGGALTEWTTGTLTSSTGRVPWAVRNSLVYYLDGSTLMKMDPYAPSLAAVVATEGSLPSSCTLATKYRDRLVLAPFRGQLWYMSRQSVYTDWDHTVDVDDLARAVWSGSCDLGSLQQPLCAMAAWGDSYMVWGLDNSLWILEGDPAAGGQIRNLSREIGIIGPDAFAWSPENDLVFIDRSGVYIMPAGGGVPIPFSREKLPTDLQNLDPSTYDIVLRYDPYRFGFLLSIMHLTGASALDPGEHWWIDWPTRSFWQLSFPHTNAPRFMEKFHYEAGEEDMLALGCDDGGVRKFDDDGDDDGTDVTGYVSIGPFRTSDADYLDGAVRELIGTMGKNSEDVTWKLFVEASAEACATATTARETGTWEAGVNYSVHARARGQAAILQLYGTGLWEFESAVAVLATLGKRRL